MNTPLKLLCILLLLFVSLSVLSARTKRPWSDEGWFANAPFTLITKGYLGTTALETANYAWLKGINRYTYWTVPLHLIVQAGAYKVFGFSLFTMRSISLFFGLVALVSWFVIVRKLSGSNEAGLLTVLFLAVDYNFVMASSFGRMDMMCAALGSAGLACYLALRQRNFPLSLFLSHCLIVASGLTHHFGILWLIASVFLVLYLDKNRLKLSYLGLVAIPYLVGALGWGLYILQSPGLFLSQFTGNAASDNRLAALTSPFRTVLREITERYFVAFGLGPHSVGHSGLIKLKAVILLVYVVAIIGFISTRELRKDRNARALLILTGIFFVVMSLWDGQKLTWYLIHIIPLFTALVALVLNNLRQRGPAMRVVFGLVVLGIAVFQIGAVLMRARSNSYRDSYLPAVAFLKSHMQPDSLIMGSAELGFGLNSFDQVIDDSRLGFASGKKPTFIVVEEVYTTEFEGLKTKYPQIYQFIGNRLSKEYELAYDQKFYQIYKQRVADNTAN